MPKANSYFDRLSSNGISFAGHSGKFVSVITVGSLAFGVAAFTLGTLFYESLNPTLLGRYSVGWAGLIILSASCFAVLLVITLRRAVSKSTPVEKRPLTSSDVFRLFISLGIATWGASLLTQYPVNLAQAGRVFRGELFGATQSGGVLLEYLAQLFLGAGIVVLMGTIAWRLRNLHRNQLYRGLLILNSLAITYLLAEGIIRVSNIASPQVQGLPTKPTRLWVQRHEIRNNYGYRDRNFAYRRSADEIRILVLGDSFTWGSGITNPSDRFTDVLAARLSRQQAIFKFKVLNAGKPDTHSVDHLRMLDALLPLSPDLVILAYTFNDIEHITGKPGNSAYNPKSLREMLGLRRLLVLNSHFFDQLFLRLRPDPMLRTDENHNRGFMAYSDANVLRTHLDVLAAISSKIRATGASFRLFPIDLGVRNGDRYVERYEGFLRGCLKRGLPAWSELQVFKPVPYENLIVNRWDHHPNERAHQLLAEFLTNKILSEKDVLFSPLKLSN